MIIVKLKWDIIEKDDSVLLILPQYIDFTHPNIFSTFRESIKKINCKFVVAIISNFKEDDIIKYEDVYDNEFQLLKDTSFLYNTGFLKYHHGDVIYVLQDIDSIKNSTFFTKVVINTFDCDEYLIEKLKSLNVPMEYGICVFNEIINANIFLKGTISLIIGEIEKPLLCEKPIDMIFNCSKFFIEGAVSYEEPTICIDVLHDLKYRLDELTTIPIFVGKFKFDNLDIKKVWNSYFTKINCIYDIDAYETLEPTQNYRISKDIPNLLKMYHSKKADLLRIHS